MLILWLSVALTQSSAARRLWTRPGASESNLMNGLYQWTSSWMRISQMRMRLSPSDTTLWSKMSISRKMLAWAGRRRRHEQWQWKCNWMWLYSRIWLLRIRLRSWIELWRSAWSNWGMWEKSSSSASMTLRSRRQAWVINSAQSRKQSWLNHPIFWPWDESDLLKSQLEVADLSHTLQVEPWSNPNSQLFGFQFNFMELPREPQWGVPRN